MQVSCAPLPVEIRVAHRHALLAAGIGAVLGPNALILEDPLATLEDPRAVGQQASQGRQHRLLITDLEKALTLQAGASATFDGQSVLVVEIGLNPQKVQSILQAGIQACISADGPLNELHLAIRALTAGRRYFCPLASAQFGDALAQPALTDRQRQVLELVCAGLDDKTISARLGIALGTVKCHLKSILAKTGKRSRTAVAAQALSHGWLASGPRIIRARPLTP